MTNPVLVVGDGISGRAVTRALALAGVAVIAVSAEPGEASASVSRPDGIDVALGEGDDPEQHAKDAVELAGPGADGATIAELTAAAPELFARLCAAGVPFERDRAGNPVLARLSGSSRARTAHAGCLTARHVARRLGAEISGLGRRTPIERRSGLDLARLIVDDDGVVVGGVLRRRSDGELESIRAHGVVLASGGHAGLFAEGERGVRSLGGALGLALAQGAKLARAGSVGFGLGYRVAGFVRALPERLVALGELDEENGRLDLSGAERARLRVAAGPALAVYAESTGRDAFAEPIAVVKTPLRAHGGLAVGRDHQTSLPGLWAVGGAACAYRGRGGSRGAPLLEDLFGGERVAEAISAWQTERRGTEPSERVFEAAAERERERYTKLFERATEAREGDTPHALLDELKAAVSSRSVERCDELRERLARAKLEDRERRYNDGLRLLGELEPLIELGRAAAEATP